MQTVNCRKCRYFFVTWQKNMPYGCRFFGFKCRYMPDQTVFSSSGSHCAQFIDKTAIDDKPTDPDDQPNGKRGFVA